jgi:hypothetical protein
MDAGTTPPAAVRCVVDVYTGADRAGRVRGGIAFGVEPGRVLRCPSRLRCTGTYDVGDEVLLRIARGVMADSFGLGCNGAERACGGRECLCVAVVRYASGGLPLPGR